MSKNVTQPLLNKTKMDEFYVENKSDQLSELIAQALKLASELSKSRASALVATKLDEARLWLSEHKE